MRIYLQVGWGLLLCWLVVACRQPNEAIAISTSIPVPPTTPETAQPYSPILIPTPTSNVDILTLPSTPAVTLIEANFSDGATIEEIRRQGDVLMTNAAPDMSSTRVKFTPATELWQRDRIALADLRIGDQISFFGRERNQRIVVDAIVVLPEPSATFATFAFYTRGHLGIGEISAIPSSQVPPVITVTADQEEKEIHPTSSAYIFRQTKANLETIEVGVDILFRGTLLRSGDRLQAEIGKAIVWYKPAQYQPEEFPLICTIIGERSHCRDAYLGIEFHHPASWGQGIGTLSPYPPSGYRYNYTFPSAWVIAGGRSHPFAEPYAGIVNNFSGFQGRSMAERCAEPNVLLCELIQPGVELTIRHFNIGAPCYPRPGFWRGPTAIIAVDLPDHQRINGMIFASDFLAETLAEELTALAPQHLPPQAPKNCDEMSQLRYEERLTRLAEQLHDNTIDVETQANLQALREMAASFRGEALPD